MIDLHCHILPGLDDGAQTIEDALAMARMAVEDGITDIVATPHTHDGVYHNPSHHVCVAVEKFQLLLDQNNLPLQVHLGNEVHVHSELLENVVEFEFLTVGNKKKYLLLELPVHSIPNITDHLVYELRMEGITPIIAHPERNVVLRENPDLLRIWIEQGAIAQLTAGSLLGEMGRRAQMAAEYMVMHRLIHVIASDGHNTSRRSPKLKQAYKLLGSMDDISIYMSNTQFILNGEDCVVREPYLKKKKRFFFV